MLGWISVAQGKARELVTQGVVDLAFVDQPVMDCEAGWDIEIVGASSSGPKLLYVYTQYLISQAYLA